MGSAEQEPESYELTIRKWDAVLRYYYHCKPETLNDEQYWNLVEEWLYVQSMERERNKNDLFNVLAEVVSKLFAKG